MHPRYVGWTIRGLFGDRNVSVRKLSRSTPIETFRFVGNLAERVIIRLLYTHLDSDTPATLARWVPTTRQPKKRSTPGGNVLRP